MWLRSFRLNVAGDSEHSFLDEVLHKTGWMKPLLNNNWLCRYSSLLLIVH
jgi:hypothetical protein